MTSDSHRDLRAPYSHRDLIRAPYVLYGVKYVDLVSLATCQARICTILWHHALPHRVCHGASRRPHIRKAGRSAGTWHGQEPRNVPRCGGGGERLCLSVQQACGLGWLHAGGGVGRYWQYWYVQLRMIIINIINLY